MGWKTPLENLRELSTLVRIRRRPEEATLAQLAVAVKELMFSRQRELHTDTGVLNMCSEEQARDIARAVLRDCGVARPQENGGLEEVEPPRLAHFIPVVGPQWLDSVQRAGLGLLRLAIHVAGFQSRYVDTPAGRMHVYDSGEPPLSTASRARAAGACPPALLQHGAFVTGWSMMLLASLLRRRRRVIVPDLLGFELGYSRIAPKFGEEQPSLDDHAESVARMLAALEIPEVDLIGHSFGGFLVQKLPGRLQPLGVRVRRLVLLNPGGPTCTLFGSMHEMGMAHDPYQMAVDNAPAPLRWLCPGLVRLQARLIYGVMFSPNNISFLGSIFHEYFHEPPPSGGRGDGPPTLVLWGAEDNVAQPRDEVLLMESMGKKFSRVEGHWILPGPIARAVDVMTLGFIQHNLQVYGALPMARHIEAFLGGPDTQDAGPGVLTRLVLAFTERATRPMVGHPPTGTSPTSARAKL